MLTIKPAEDSPQVFSFDGEVLEIFRVDGSLRYHVCLIEKLELKTDRKGKHTLDISLANTYSNRDNRVDENAVSKVNQLIAEVDQAKAGFRLD